MQPNKQFQKLDKSFWANVRFISQQLGYTLKAGNKVRTFTLSEIVSGLEKAGLATHHLVLPDGAATPLGVVLIEYFAYRAEILNTYVEPRLMDAERASQEFNALFTRLSPNCPIPMNKQSGDKKQPQFLTGLVNMLIEAYSDNLPCDYNPRVLTTVTANDVPLRTLSRRVDGCFPSCVNPIAIWEIKGYYYTTTFGSRIADGVYETLLDGMELEELAAAGGSPIQHLLIVDSPFTWWTQGKSYLCRIIDMLHMGYVDEVLFGYEVIERLPDIVRRWVDRYKSS